MGEGGEVWGEGGDPIGCSKLDSCCKLLLASSFNRHSSEQYSADGSCEMIVRRRGAAVVEVVVVAVCSSSSSSSSTSTSSTTTSAAFTGTWAFLPAILPCLPPPFLFIIPFPCPPPFVVLGTGSGGGITGGTSGGGTSSVCFVGGIAFSQTEHQSSIFSLSPPTIGISGWGGGEE